MSRQLQKKFDDLLAGEDGTTRKAWGDHLTVCLAYPNLYRTGMSNLGFQTVYRLLNAHPSVVCERVFLPDPEDVSFYSSGSLPLFSLESRKPLQEFDVVAFSLSFENDYPHVLQMLSLGKIPLIAADRHDKDPLILAGGIAVTMNPEPLADFMDLFLLGEGEEMLPDLIDILAAGRPTGWGKDAVLHELQKNVVGAYIPRFYQVAYDPEGPITDFFPIDAAFPKRIEKRWVKDLDAAPTDQAISAPQSAFGHMFLTEVSRGCGRGCRFCAAGYVYRPPRIRRWETLEPSIVRGLAQVNRIGLLGTAVSDHPELERICRFILDRQGQIAVGSLRLDQLTPTMVGMLKEGGIETLSLAPEAGSQRLRDMIRKGIGEDQIHDMATSLLAQGIINIRTYFMIGLPTETDDDITALIDLVTNLSRRTSQADDRETKFRRITVSINQFIPKPVTPLQWYPLESIEVARKKIRRIKAAFQQKTPVRIQAESPKGNYLQTLLSVGDRRVGAMLLDYHRHGNWPQAFKASTPHPDFWVYRRKDPGEILPWDFIDHGVRKSFLVEEYRKTLPVTP